MLRFCGPCCCGVTEMQLEVKGVEKNEVAVSRCCVWWWESPFAISGCSFAFPGWAFCSGREGGSVVDGNLVPASTRWKNVQFPSGWTIGRIYAISDEMSLSCGWRRSWCCGKVSLSRTRLWVVMQYCKCWFYCCSCEKACKGDLLTSWNCVIGFYLTFK